MSPRPADSTPLNHPEPKVVGSMLRNVKRAFIPFLFGWPIVVRQDGPLPSSGGQRPPKHEKAEEREDDGISRWQLGFLAAKHRFTQRPHENFALVVSLALVPCAFPDAALAQGVPPGYSDLNGVLLRMQEIAAAHPEIAQVVDITSTYGAPPTVEGRHLFALKISDNVATDEDEPAMLIVATHHAREISTPVIALEAASRLTAGYGPDPRITAAVDGHEIWIAPVWNPDGYDFVFTANNMWRKNRRAVRERHGRRSEPQLPAGLDGLVRGQHQRVFRHLQGAVGGVRGRNADDDDLVAGGAVRESHRLPLERPRSAVRVSMPEPPVHELDAAGSRHALARVRATAAWCAFRAPRASIRNGSSPKWARTRSSSRPTRSSSRRTRAR